MCKEPLIRFFCDNKVDKPLMMKCYDDLSSVACSHISYLVDSFINFSRCFFQFMRTSVLVNIHKIHRLDGLLYI